MNTPDFQLTCTTLSKEIPAGQSDYFQTSLSYSGGFNSPVTVSITAGLPSGATSSPVTVTPPATTGSVPVQTSISTPQGTSLLTFTATGGGQSHTCTAELTVTPPDANPTLDHIDLWPSDSTIEVGQQQPYTVTAWYTDGTTQNVTLNPNTNYDSADTAIATMAGHIATGVADGDVPISADYTEGGITVADSSILHVGSKGAGTVTATLNCPAGSSTKVCTIPHNTSVNLSWSSSGADQCESSPTTTPLIKDPSGTASTGALSGPNTYTYTLTCEDAGGTTAQDTATVIVEGAGVAFVQSDKDITHINGQTLAQLGLPAPSPCSGGTDSIGGITFKDGDVVSFRICIRNTGAGTATGITITDQLTNLVQPSGGWNARYQGSPITPVYNQGAGTLTFSIPGSIAPGASTTLTLDAQIQKPAGSNSFTLYRFQNLARFQTDQGNHTVNTPLYLFYAGSQVPSKEEVAP